MSSFILGWGDLEIEALTPPEKLTVSEWADKYRIMGFESSLPGRWRTDNAPYLREVMDCTCLPYLKKVGICSGTQIGKTEALINIFAYTVDNDPAPMLIVYPDEDLAKRAGRDRLTKAIDKCDRLKHKFLKGESGQLNLRFTTMVANIVSARSPSKLAMMPCKVVLMDEIDKFPLRAGSEADPIKLAEERTKTFLDSTTYRCSTPTYEWNHIWQFLLSSEVVKQFYVQCPRCGQYIPLRFDDIRWPDRITKEWEDAKQDETKIAAAAMKAKRAAQYICPECGDKILYKEKRAMLRTGKWMRVYLDDKGVFHLHPHQTPENPPETVCYHLSSLYSPWLSWGDIAAEFLESRKFVTKFQNFVNSWLAEPWREKTVSVSSAIVKERQTENPRMKVPEGTTVITAGVDVQKDHFWFVIRAWRDDMSSQVIDCGRLETFDQIRDRIVDGVFRDANDNIYQVSLAFIDAGYRTDEVYSFCANHSQLCVPCAGAEYDMKGSLYQVKSVNRDGNVKVKLYHVNTDFYKTMIFDRLSREPDSPGAWAVYKNISTEYCNQITSEEKMLFVDPKTGKSKLIWKKKSSHADNHMLDCEVYAACAAEVMGIRYKNGEYEEGGA